MKFGVISKFNYFLMYQRMKVFIYFINGGFFIGFVLYSE